MNIKFPQKLLLLDLFKRVNNGIKQKPVFLTLFLLFIFLFQSVLYIFQINNVATKGYKVENLEKQLAGLKQKNYQYLVEEADLRSMNRIEKGVRGLELTQVQKKEYADNGSIDIASLY